MNQISRLWQTALAVLGILVIVALPASAATPQGPFLGPPGMHANTVPGQVNVGGSAQQAYPKYEPDYLSNQGIYLQSPWSACETMASTQYVISIAKVSGSTYYNQFTHWNRTFLIDQFDGNAPIGGSYTGWGDDKGTLALEKSSAGKATYDQVRLAGSKGSGPVNVVLSLVEQSGTIGVANIASLGAIKPCGSANANSQIMLPLGTGADGQRTIILDIDGDGVADPGFLQGPGLSGALAQAATSVPTLSQWGLIGLTLLLLIVGLRFSRKNAPFASA